MNLRRRLVISATLVLVMGLVTALARPAFAADDGALVAAQAAFDRAQDDYVAKRYDEAAAGFLKAYESRPFPQFLYNSAAAFHMKGKAGADVAAYEKAVEGYKRYLQADPAASDKAKVEKAITVLEAEIKRLKAAPVVPPGTAPNPATTAPSQEVQNLGDVKVRGLLVIESEPTGATIYLDDKSKGKFGTTPWSGQLEGEHLVIVEKEGYKAADSKIAANPDRLTVLKLDMSEASFFGRVEITSNVPGAEVYADDRTVGAIGKTPLKTEFKPGKHKIWVTAEGYDEVEKELDVIAGETAEVAITLKGGPVGYVYVRGQDIEQSSIWADGELLCERGPCRKALREGWHRVTVSRDGYKSYTRRIEVQAKTETSIKVSLAKKPSRSDAIAAYALSAVFLGGGAYAGLQSNKLRDELDADIMAGTPPVDSEDPRFLRGKIYAWVADGAFVLGGVTALTAIYYTFRDKGLPSTAILDVGAVGFSPQVGPTYAGLGMEVSW